jgi:hypothetical protein
MGIYSWDIILQGVAEVEFCKEVRNAVELLLLFW